jgi:hypothetical protein
MAHRNIATAAPLDGAEPGQTAPQTLSPRGNTREISHRAGPLHVDGPVFHSFFHTCGKLRRNLISHWRSEWKLADARREATVAHRAAVRPEDHIAAQRGAPGLVVDTSGTGWLLLSVHYGRRIAAPDFGPQDTGTAQ